MLLSNTSFWSIMTAKFALVGKIACVNLPVTKQDIVKNVHFVIDHLYK